MDSSKNKKNNSNSHTRALSNNPPIAFIQRYLGFDTPVLSRATYRLELISIIFSSMGMAVAVGEYSSYLAKQGFDATDFLISAIIAAPPIGSMLCSLLSGHLRSFKQANVAGFARMIGGILIALIATLPRFNALSPWIFTILSTLVCTTMMVNTHARTQIWKSNYPNNGRGQIVGRILIAQLALTGTWAKIVGLLFDKLEVYPNIYRWIYIAAGLAWIISGLIFRKIPVRGDHKRIAQQSPTQSRNPLRALGVLITDSQFAKYQTLQMLQGTACMMLGPILTLVLTERFNADYSQAAGIIVTIPFAVQVLMLSPLGKLFDRMSVFRFRFYGSMFWGIARYTILLALHLGSMPVLMLSYVFQGMGQSYGRLAWSMGHMSFGTPEQNLTYMSAHMMLAGIRGIIVPFLAVYFYRETGDSVIWFSAILLTCVSVTFRFIDPHKDKKPAAAMQ